MTRWDSPLFTVPYDDKAPPCQDIWNAMVGSEGEVKTVKPNLATVMVEFQFPNRYNKRKLMCPYRNQPPSRIISTSLTRPHKTF